MCTHPSSAAPGWAHLPEREVQCEWARTSPPASSSEERLDADAASRPGTLAAPHLLGTAGWGLTDLISLDR